MPSFETCVFCGSSPTNNEDVIPRWLVKDLRLIPPATRRIGRTFADRTDLGGAAAQKVAGIGVGKVRAVCRDACNNGWMKRLEDRAKPVLHPMIKDSDLSLDATAQETVGAWAFKTALMLTVMYTKLPSPRLRQSISRDGGPSPTSVVWLSRVKPDNLRVEASPVIPPGLARRNDPPRLAAPSVRNGQRARRICPGTSRCRYGGSAPPNCPRPARFHVRSRALLDGRR